MFRKGNSTLKTLFNILRLEYEVVSFRNHMQEIELKNIGGNSI